MQVADRPGLARSEAVMLEDTEQIEAVLARPAAAARIALNILEKWDATAEQMTAILDASPAERAHWRKTDAPTLTEAQFERIRHIVSMWAYLRVLFPQSYLRWPNIPNKYVLFNGATPIALMGAGRLEDLRQVSRWLASWRYN